MPVLLVVSGPPGSGKSTVADALAGLRPVVRLSIDDVEDAMRACGLAAADTGIAAYEVVRAAARQNLVLGRDVVVDAVNDSSPARATWERAAAGAVLLFAVIDPPEPALHRARLEGRTRPFPALPEPRWTDVVRLVAASEPWPDPVERLDGARPAAELAEALARLLDSSPPSPGAA